jgi:hypothetical protein
VTRLDLFELVLEELEAEGLLEDLVKDERSYDKVELLDTLQNFSDPRTHLIPRPRKIPVAAPSFACSDRCRALVSTIRIIAR